MKKTLAFVAVAVLSIAGIALAQEARIDLYRFSPQWFTRGIYVGPEVAPNVSSSIVNRLSRVIGGVSASTDFAATASACQDSATFTVSGARVGDECIAGVPSAFTAIANASLSCRVTAADTVVVRMCAAGTPGDPAASTYPVLILSNQ